MLLSNLTSISNLDTKKIQRIKIWIVIGHNCLISILNTINLILNSLTYSICDIYVIDFNNIKKDNKKTLQKIYGSCIDYTNTSLNLDYVISQDKENCLNIKYRKHITMLKEKDFQENGLYNNVNWKKIREGNSIIVGCKNREKNLFVSLKSRLSIKDLDEIIIIDWSSDEEIMIPYKDSRIKVYKVKNQTKWCLTKAYNLAILLSNYTNILKLDSEDVIKNLDFFSFYKLSEKIFFSGNVNFLLEKNDYQFSGKLYIKRKKLLSVNWYNEYIRLYWFDDIDLKKRLVNLWMKNKSLEINDFSFIHNSDKSRLQWSDVEIHKMLYLHAKIYKDNIPRWDTFCHMSEYKYDWKSFFEEKEYTICIFTQFYLRKILNKPLL